MKIFNKKKTGQTIVEFALIAALVGIVGGWAFIKMNPGLFRNYFKSSVSSTNNIDSNGQMKLCTYDDNNCTAPIPPAPPPPPPPPGTCDPMAIGGVEPDGSVYTGNASGNDLCTTPAANETLTTWNNGAGGNLVTGANNALNGIPNTNTLKVLVNAHSPYQAALYCANLNFAGHTDWYLPSQVEMSIIYVNRAAIGGFSPSHYWSSTEVDGEHSYVIDFPNFGNVQSEDKDNNQRVRCVRHD